MAKIRVVDSETARENNAAELEQLSQSRAERLREALETTPLQFPEREQVADEQLATAEFQRFAGRGLARELALAAAAEVEARALEGKK